MAVKIIECIHCNKPFSHDSKHPYQKFCSSKCSYDYWRFTPKGKEIQKRSQKKYLTTLEGRIVRRRLNRKKRLKPRYLIEVFTDADWIRKLKATKGYCEKCGKYIGIRKLQIDHCLPIYKAPLGYIYTIKDVRPICKVCNYHKPERKKK